MYYVEISYKNQTSWQVTRLVLLDLTCPPGSQKFLLQYAILL